MVSLLDVLMEELANARGAVPAGVQRRHQLGFLDRHPRWTRCAAA